MSGGREEPAFGEPNQSMGHVATLAWSTTSRGATCLDQVWLIETSKPENLFHFSVIEDDSRFR